MNKVEEIKRAASGRWCEIFTVLGGVSAHILDGKHHPCPRCGGTDRFRCIDAEVGSLLCNQCFSERNGDGLAALQWLCGWSFSETLRQVANYLGLNGAATRRKDTRKRLKASGNSPSTKGNLISIARAWHGHPKAAEKRAELAAQLGVEVWALELLRCGWSGDRWTFPERNAHGEVVGISYRHADGCKTFRRGGRRGAIAPAGWPEPKHPDGNPWVNAGGPILLPEGASDTAALLSMGLLAVGRPQSNLGKATAPHLVGLPRLAELGTLVIGERDQKPDGTWPGRDGAKQTAERLARALGAAVQWAMIPAPHKDVRVWLQQRRNEHGAEVDSEKLRAWGRELLAELKRTAQVAMAIDPSCPYQETASGLAMVRETENGIAEIPLATFMARIQEVVHRDDGVESHTEYLVRARTPRRERTFSVPATVFPRVKQWASEHLGPEAYVVPGQLKEDHTSVAIRVLSPEPTEKTIFTHSGWREINGRQLYLHCGGAIGAEGDSDSFEVDLPDQLQRFDLPYPPTGKERREAIESTLRLLVELGPLEVVAPVWCSIWRAILGDVPFGIFIVGPTGTFKTQVAALAQQHFGVGFNAADLPANWSFTANAIEMIGFHAKDAMLVVDDFRPNSPNDSLHRVADRLFRNAANRAGRGRLTSRAELTLTKSPRCLYLATGEDLPRGESLRARLVIVELEHGTITSAKLTDAQARAADGQFAAGTAAFIARLAEDDHLTEARQALRDTVAALRAQHRFRHARTITSIAELFAAGKQFVTFAHEVGACDRADLAWVDTELLLAMLRGGKLQERYLQAADPAARFIELIGAAISSGHAHLADQSGGCPTDPSAWGWRLETRGAVEDWTPRGDRIGWVGEGVIYLEPAATFRIAQQMAAGSEPIEVTQTTLGQRLLQRGIIAATNPGRTTQRVMTGDGRHRVWTIHQAVLQPAEGDERDDAT